MHSTCTTCVMLHVADSMLHHYNPCRHGHLLCPHECVVGQRHRFRQDLHSKKIIVDLSQCLLTGTCAWSKSYPFIFSVEYAQVTNHEVAAQDCTLLSRSNTKREESALRIAVLVSLFEHVTFNFSKIHLHQKFS